MIEAFKTGQKLPKRVVWEIILGVKAIVDKERSMVKRVVDEGVVCDIIGDTHGVSLSLLGRVWCEPARKLDRRLDWA
jgi:hypothetical protein